MSGIMLMLKARGASAFAFTISSNQTNANLATLATAAGWNGTSALTATIGSGVYISSNSTGTPALTVNGSFPGGVTLVNNGYIYGMGGAGGNAGTSNGSGPGSAGGLALSVSSAITIDNTSGVIGGGGGGGGAGGFGGSPYGGGGGGGISSFSTNSSGGSGNATGGAGTYTAAGAGAGGGFQQVCICGTKLNYQGGTGGTGGSRGSSGSGGSNGNGNGTIRTGGGGGSGGGAVSGNSNITWTATGSRLGSIT